MTIATDRLSPPDASSMFNPTQNLGTAGLDQVVELVTPERVIFEYRVAGPFQRGTAYLIDLFIYAAFLFIIAMGLSLVFGILGLDGFSQGLFLVILFFAGWFYGGFFESIFNGKTPGKAVMNLRVVSPQGVPISPGQAILRNLFLPIEGITMGYLPALVAMVLTGGGRRIGDLAAETMVISEERPAQAELQDVEEPAVLELTDALPPRLELSSQIARTLSDYVATRKRLSLERREEIAVDLAGRLSQRYGLPGGYYADTVLCACYRRIYLERE